MDPPPDVPPGAEDEDPSPSEVEDEGNGIDSVDEIDFSEEKMKEPCIKSMADLENHLVTFKLEECKLHACLDQFLKVLTDVRDKARLGYSDSLLDFSKIKGNDSKRIEVGLVELQKNITRLLPGFLEDESDILSNEKLKERLERRWYSFQDDTVNPQNSGWQKQKDEPAQFQKRLAQKITRQQLQKLQDIANQGPGNGGARSLSSLAFDKACSELGQCISGERATASFTCGGTIPIRDTEKAEDAVATSTQKRPLSSPVQVWWASKDVTVKERLVLPLNHHAHPDSTVPRLHQLVADCEVASFGKGQQDIIDPEYRMAGKLDPERFESSFHPADFGIIESIEQILLPRYVSKNGNCLPLRKLSAELYKLNVYSGPSGLFQAHVDTPRSEDQIGSLVVCLPSPFEGGNLLVRHHGKEVSFEWSSESAQTIQWAAFYSDCEHEIKTVTEGHRITLTYNLYVTRPLGGSIPPNTTVSPKSLPVYSLLRDQLAEPGFMKDGGVLGICCSHGYPHTSDNAQELLPTGLKAADLAVYSALAALGIETKILPVLDAERDSDSSYEMVSDCEKFLKKGETFAPEYCQYPPKIPVDEDVDRYWKTLLASRYYSGMREVVDFARQNNLEINPSSIWEQRGVFVGDHLIPYTTSDIGEEEGSIGETIEYCWPSQYLPAITWIGGPTHWEMAFSYIAYGNQSSIAHMYSYAAIIADIPPFQQRQAVMAALE